MPCGRPKLYLGHHTKQPSDVALMYTLTPQPPFGSYAPTRSQRRVISLTRAMPYNGLGRRAALLLRKIVLRELETPLDVDLWNARLRLCPAGNITDGRLLFMPQFFDPVERAILASRLTKGSLFLDIGANIGAYSLFAAGCSPDVRVLAFEPQPEVYHRLATNVACNPAFQIEVHRLALADRDGTIDSSTSSSSSFHSLRGVRVSLF